MEGHRHCALSSRRRNERGRTILKGKAKAQSIRGVTSGILLYGLVGAIFWWALDLRQHGIGQRNLAGGGHCPRRAPSWPSSAKSDSDRFIGWASLLEPGRRMHAGTYFIRATSVESRRSRSGRTGCSGSFDREEASRLSLPRPMRTPFPPCTTRKVPNARSEMRHLAPNLLDGSTGGRVHGHGHVHRRGRRGGRRLELALGSMRRTVPDGRPQSQPRDIRVLAFVISRVLRVGEKILLATSPHFDLSTNLPVSTISSSSSPNPSASQRR